jgi:hypothetical protein
MAITNKAKKARRLKIRLKKVDRIRFSHAVCMSVALANDQFHPPADLLRDAITMMREHIGAYSNPWITDEFEAKLDADVEERERFLWWVSVLIRLESHCTELPQWRNTRAVFLVQKYKAIAAAEATPDKWVN